MRSHDALIVARVQIAMVRTKAVLFSLSLFAVAGLLFLAGCKDASSSSSAVASVTPHDSSDDGRSDGGGDDGDHSPPRPCDGTYNVLIRGDYQGGGTASVSGDSVQITATVTNSSGEKGTFSFSGTMTNKRFSGAGTIMGTSAKVSGRVDALDSGSKGSVLKASRLVSTIVTSDGHFARVAGEP